MIGGVSYRVDIYFLLIIWLARTILWGSSDAEGQEPRDQQIKKLGIVEYLSACFQNVVGSFPCGRLIAG